MSHPIKRLTATAAAAAAFLAVGAATAQSADAAAAPAPRPAAVTRALVHSSTGARPDLSIQEWKIGPFGYGVAGWLDCQAYGVAVGSEPDSLYTYCQADNTGDWYLYDWIISLD